MVTTSEALVLAFSLVIFSTSTRSAPLYSKKLEGSVVKRVIRCLTTDTRLTGVSAF